MTDQIAINFRRFHAENPHVYELFTRFANDMLLRGYKNGSASLIFERIRWELMISTTQDQIPPKLNNNYRALYARLWERDNPLFAGFFRKRARSANTIDSTWKATT